MVGPTHNNLGGLEEPHLFKEVYNRPEFAPKPPEKATCVTHQRAFCSLVKTEILDKRQ